MIVDPNCLDGLNVWAGDTREFIQRRTQAERPAYERNEPSCAKKVNVKHTREYAFPDIHDSFSFTDSSHTAASFQETTAAYESSV